MKSIFCSLVFFVTAFSAHAQESVDCGDDLKITLSQKVSRTSEKMYKVKLNKRFSYGQIEANFESEMGVREIAEFDGLGSKINVKEYIWGERQSKMDYRFIYLQFLPTGEFFDLKVWSAGTLYRLKGCVVKGFK